MIPEFASWRLIYWIKYVLVSPQNVIFAMAANTHEFSAPFCLLITLGLVFLYPSEHRGTSHRGSLRRVDFLGSILLLAATVLMVFGLQEAGSRVYTWKSAATVSTLTVSAVCFAAFVAWETWLSICDRRTEPLFPLRLVAKRVYMACLVYVTTELPTCC